MTTMRALPPLLLPAVALGLALLGAGVARAEPPGCGAPPEMLEAAPLPGAFAALARGELRVMVVGSASTEAGGTSGPNATWPERLRSVLGARVSPASVQVRVFGGRGTTAADHARIIAEQAPRLRPHLIVWQLGTVEAARGLPADDMSDTVQETIARLRATRGERTDVILMDPQFSRFFRANADVETYRDRLRLAAAAGGAQLFSRWTIMKHWAETERLDLERAARGQRVAVADELHDCLARALTEFILAGTLHHR
ncbi:SGNH/GDSL hydrolase family protein [Falsiroseomonas sp. CW058]|uniref:SGNH/GDSL hydrolase family protein n=1 Tax=Falsiroseomonas sp. CW058 TaxID=3388664 RepID=UPI003D3189A6